jgi:hypothetical protein
VPSKGKQRVGSLETERATITTCASVMVPTRWIKVVLKQCPSSVNPLSPIPSTSSSLPPLLSFIPSKTINTTMLTSTNMNPFAEWNTRSSDSSPSIFGALPSIPIAPTLPVFISDSLVLRFSANDNVLHCVLLGPQNRTLFCTNSSGTRTTFRNVDNAVFAVVDFGPHATVEVQGFTPRQPVRDWLRLTSDKRYGPIILSPGVLGHLIIRFTAPGGWCSATTCVCGDQWDIILW